MTMSRGRRDVSMSSSLNVVAGVDATRVVVARVAREEFAKLVTANASAPVRRGDLDRVDGVPVLG